MPVYIVTYDLNRETTRPKIVEAIRAYGDWAKLSESSYAIETVQTPQQVFSALNAYIDGNDNLSVITLAAPWYSQNNPKVLDWLKERLR